MAGKIRVYELARELGLTNKEMLDLCAQLGIGVKSHSSSIEEAQADRARRKADQLGLRRPVQPEESEAPKKPARKAEPEAAPVVPAPAPERPARLVTSRAERAEPQRAAPEPPRPAVRPAAAAQPAAAAPAPAAQPAAAAPPAPAPAVGRPAAGTRPAEAQQPPARPAVAGTQPAATAQPAAGTQPGQPAAGPGAGVPPPRPLLSPSGKPIPPPPGRGPLSPSGKPIPPPPGLGGRAPAPGAGRPGAGAGRPGAGTGRPGAPGAGRPSYTPSRPGGGQFPRSSVPGAGVGRGTGPGAPAGRGGPAGATRGRPPQRQKRRRRRVYEELLPTEVTTYTPSNKPVPEGEIVVERGITAQELGPKLNRTAADVVRFLFTAGEMVTATQPLTDEMIELFAQEIGANVLIVEPGEEQELQLQELLSDEDAEADESKLRPRPPVITVMGHVDHGKTLLLDRIRHTNVVEGEAGGITQHIGAYQVEKDGKLITFIDTPGHEAFTAMRARGAKVTDIAVLVVAADDGVMPTTIEAINHARAAGVPIVVAINKIDKENADPNRVRQQLAEQGLVPEEWGGDTIMVEISALHGLGIDELLEQLLLVAEIEELKANPEGRARGVVLEANLDVGKGPVATVLVQQGTLRVGDPVVAGAAWGRVRAMINDRGEQVKEAPPSTPVQVLGLSAVPNAGDEFRVAPDERTARTVAEARERRYRERDLKRAPTAVGHGARLEDIFEQIQRGETATLNLVLKADVQGSLEAVTEALRKLERDEVKLSFVHRAVGGITENDVQLASVSNATIIGFNVRPDRKARELAEQLDVEIRTYEIIYKLLEDVEAAMVGMLRPEFEEVVTGEAEVREVFTVPRVGRVAGCYVRSGVITRGAKVRFLRDGVVIWKGTISSLKRFKEDVREVQAGYECGVGLSDFQDLKQGDIIETYEEREIPRT